MNVEIRVQIFSMALVLYMSIVRFEALEQTLRLRLVSGPVDKKCFLSLLPDRHERFSNAHNFVKNLVLHTFYSAF